MGRRSPRISPMPTCRSCCSTFRAKEGDRNGIAPGPRRPEDWNRPLANKGKLKYVDAANYEEHLPLLAECDLVIEAIAERMDWKNDLYARIAPHPAPTPSSPSNTSGLSINLPGRRSARSGASAFCGIHFFNPPRYMRWSRSSRRATDAATLDALETWLDPRSARSHPRLDTPELRRQPHRRVSRFAVMHYTAAFGPASTKVDALTGPAHRAPEERDLPHRRRRRPRHAGARRRRCRPTRCPAIRGMPTSRPRMAVGADRPGALGQKTRCGIFRKQGRDIQGARCRHAGLPGLGWHPSPDEVGEILKIRNPGESRRRCAPGASAGASSVGHLPRYLPLRRRPSRKRRRQRP